MTTFIWQGSTQWIILQWFGTDQSGNTHTTQSSDGKEDFKPEDRKRSLRTSELDDVLMGWFIFLQYSSPNFIHQNTATVHNTFLSALTFSLLPEITWASKLDYLTPCVTKLNRKFKITSKYFIVYIFPFIF